MATAQQYWNLLDTHTTSDLALDLAYSIQHEGEYSWDAGDAFDLARTVASNIVENFLYHYGRDTFDPDDEISADDIRDTSVGETHGNGIDAILPYTRDMIDAWLATGCEGAWYNATGDVSHLDYPQITGSAMVLMRSDLSVAINEAVDLIACTIEELADDQPVEDTTDFDDE